MITPYLSHPVGLPDIGVPIQQRIERSLPRTAAQEASSPSSLLFHFFHRNCTSRASRTRLRGEGRLESVSYVRCSVPPSNQCANGDSPRYCPRYVCCQCTWLPIFDDSRLRSLPMKIPPKPTKSLQLNMTCRCSRSCKSGILQIHIENLLALAKHPVLYTEIAIAACLEETAQFKCPRHISF